MLMLPQNNKGFTLVEVLVAFVILIVGLLGLLQAVNVALLHNLKNQVRDEAVQVAATEMNTMRIESVDSVVSVAGIKKPSRLRGGKTDYYTVNREVSILPSGSRQYRVDVQWQVKGETYSHTVVTVRGIRE